MLNSLSVYLAADKVYVRQSWRAAIWKDCLYASMRLYWVINSRILKC